MSENNFTPNTQQQPPRLRVMLVDDSALVRSFLKISLAEYSDIDVVAQAENGKVATQIIQSVNPDVVILDIEMPEMDGITCLPHLLDLCPNVRVIMLSTLTTHNAAVSIRALSIGAADYMEKPTAQTNKGDFKAALVAKIRMLGASIKRPEVQSIASVPAPVPTASASPTKAGRFAKPDAVAIGCSTGGPQALIELFSNLDLAAMDVPVFVTQHMPPTFTTFLADSIRKSCNVNCIEAQDGMDVVPGTAYLAQGDYHMTIHRNGLKAIIKLDQGPHENFCRPAVDPMLRSLVDVYGKNLLVIIMTGMGQDGLEGVRVVAEKGGHILIQDEASSVVWGMPGAVSKANLQHGTHTIPILAQHIMQICKGGSK